MTMSLRAPARAARVRLAALAAAMLLVAACTDTKAPPVLSKDPVADSADQVMFGVRHFLTDDGVRQAQLLSDTAFMFDEGTRILLRKVRLTFYTETGVQNAVLVARRGRYDTRSQVMEGNGDVVVTTTDGRRLETEQLKFDQAKNEISSDSAYVATEGGRRQSGVGFRSDPNMNNVQCLRSCSVVAGAVNLPTQGAPPAAPAAPAPDRRDTSGALKPGDRPGSFRLP
jgi:LPS export ABC transporter protein LptC